MAADGNRLSIFNLQGSLADICGGVLVCSWKSLSRLCLDVFLNMTNMNVPFLPHATKIHFVSCKHEMLRADISSGYGVAYLLWCCLPRLLFSSLYLIQKVET